jgi:light-regulated signal transduction histidine kinase (bacteriophytochrome)
VPPIIEIKCHDKNEYWEFSISDNGIGIESDYHEKIFVIFQRLHNKDEYSGTGIGLAICRKIIESLGGKIWITSVLNEGSTFYFTIPKQI